MFHLFRMEITFFMFKNVTFCLPNPVVYISVILDTAVNGISHMSWSFLSVCFIFLKVLLIMRLVASLAFDLAARYREVNSIFQSLILCSFYFCLPLFFLDFFLRKEIDLILYALLWSIFPDTDLKYVLSQHEILNPRS